MLSPSSTESATGRRFTGVDSGGTFTDLVAIDIGSGTIQVAKVPSTPSRPVVAVAESLERLESRRIARLVHGTTVATNAVLQRSGARLCLLTTEGFEDIAYIQRINRPRAYDLLWQKPDPLVAKRRCYGVRERIGSEGEVLLPLAEETVSSVVARMEDLVLAGEIDAIAICLLFSYANDAHEQLLGRRLRRALPDTPVSVSSEVSPVWREYERTSTVLTDAYIKPLMSRYFDDLATETSRFLDGSPLTILKSNGGTGNVSTVAPKPVTTILSGLAGGVVGGAYFATAESEPLAITFDMGGTSTDIGLVSDGQVGHINEYEVEWGLPVVTPVVDVHTIGAGGGSIAAVDTGSLLQVGPRSAGARPGPACYGLGGSKPTVTDANLVLGRLNPHYFLGGTVKLEPQAAFDELAELARQLQVSTVEAATAVVAVADENMANAIRLVTIERGVDPRDFALIAFGGAGPLHACGVAEAVGIRRIVVPPNPGLCSAFGAAIARLRTDRVWSIGKRLDDISEAVLQADFEASMVDVTNQLYRDGATGSERVALFGSCRYYLQNHEHEIDLGADLEPGFLARLRADFHRAHEAAYGYSFPTDPVELVHCRVTALEPYDAALGIDFAYRDGSATPGSTSARAITFAGSTELEVPVYGRASVTEVVGPAVIDEPDSTILVSPGWVARLTGSGSIVMERE